MKTDRQHRQERAAVLVTAMWIAIALAAVVLVLCRTMMVEYLTIRHTSAQSQADAAELGAEQFVLSIVEQEMVSPGYKDQTTWEARRLGDSYFWVLGNPEDDFTPTYGIVDEASKIDINTATADMMLYLPGMTEEVAYAIRDWIDEDDTTAGLLGAESTEYLSEYGYRAKNKPLESLDELRLIYGVVDHSLTGPDREWLLYGADANHDGVISDLEAGSANAGLNFSTSMRGIMPFITVYGVRATNPSVSARRAMEEEAETTGDTSQTVVDVNTLNTQAGRTALTTMLNNYMTTGAGTIAQRSQQLFGQTGFTSIWDWAVKLNLTSAQMGEIYPYISCKAVATTTAATQPAEEGAASAPTPPFGKLNLNTASYEAMLCLPGFTETEAQAIVDYRNQNVQTDPTQLNNVSWVMDQIDPTILQQAGAYITGKSTVFSADIVTVSKDGRAFKRVKIVVDASTGTPAIIYRRDLSADGWPLDPAIRDALRKGEEVTATQSRRSSSSPLMFAR